MHGSLNNVRPSINIVIKQFQLSSFNKYVTVLYATHQMKCRHDFKSDKQKMCGCKKLFSLVETEYHLLILKESTLNKLIML